MQKLEMGLKGWAQWRQRNRELGALQARKREIAWEFNDESRRDRVYLEHAKTVVNAQLSRTDWVEPVDAKSYEGELLGCLPEEVRENVDALKLGYYVAGLVWLERCCLNEKFKKERPISGMVRNHLRPRLEKLERIQQTAITYFEGETGVWGGVAVRAK